ncbi:MAG TPA: hypothetical protein VGL99_27625 [Chloroflexota bacterium]
MNPSFELAAFTVRDGNEAALLAERPAMLEALRRAFPGLLAAWLTKRDDGSWLDVILWRTRAEAETAAQHVKDIAEAASWFRHIAESRGLQHVDVVDQRLFVSTLGEVRDPPSSAQHPWRTS